MRFWYRGYRVVQVNFTPESEVFYMLFERYFSIVSVTSLKQHRVYFQCPCKIQLDLPVGFLPNGFRCCLPNGWWNRVRSRWFKWEALKRFLKSRRISNVLIKSYLSNQRCILVYDDSVIVSLLACTGRETMPTYWMARLMIQPYNGIRSYSHASHLNRMVRSGESV